MDPLPEKPEMPETKPEALSCKICGESLRARTVVRCARCKTLHHLDCWRFNKGCSMYGCGCRSWEDAPGALASTGPEGFCRQEGMTPSRGATLVALPVILGCLIFTLAAALNGAFLLALLPASLAMLVAAAGIRFGLCRERLQVDSAHGAMRWTLELFGAPLARKDDWLAAADVVELQTYTLETRGWLDFALHALLANGERRLLRRALVAAGGSKREELESFVARLAVFADCTVRKMDSNLPPTQAEIQEALAQRRAERAAPAPKLESPAGAEARDIAKREQPPEKTA